MAVISFCSIASAVYIINDIYDLEQDKLHELKRLRPLAAGAVSIWNAILLLVLMVVLATGLALLVSLSFFYVIAGYFFLNLVYSLYLKNISLIDISVIAIGFILRVLAGGIAAQVSVSKWLILMTFLLACCLALGKRRDDLLLDVDKQTLRQSLKGYTLRRRGSAAALGSHLFDLDFCYHRHIAFSADRDRRANERFADAHTFKGHDDPGDDRSLVPGLSDNPLCLIRQ